MKRFEQLTIVVVIFNYGKMDYDVGLNSFIFSIMCNTYIYLYCHCFILAVIYFLYLSFGQLIVRMREAEGLCSPGTSRSVTIHLDPESSQTVTFSAVPMVTGGIPISIELYEIESRTPMDAIKKILLVKVSGDRTGKCTSLLI